MYKKEPSFLGRLFLFFYLKITNRRRQAVL